MYCGQVAGDSGRRQGATEDSNGALRSGADRDRPRSRLAHKRRTDPPHGPVVDGMSNPKSKPEPEVVLAAILAKNGFWGFSSFFRPVARGRTKSISGVWT